MTKTKIRTWKGAKYFKNWKNIIKIILFVGTCWAICFNKQLLNWELVWSNIMLVSWKRTTQDDKGHKKSANVVFKARF